MEIENLNLVGFRTDLQPRVLIDIKETQSKCREGDHVIYADYSPFMLIGEGSLAELNGRIAKKVTMRNFRPNFVARGCSAFDEDSWTHFTIGTTKFLNIKPGTRFVKIRLN